MNRTYEDWEITCQERIKKSERCVLHSYLDPKNIPTFGWGHNLRNRFTMIEKQFIISRLHINDFTNLFLHGIDPFKPQYVENTFDRLTAPQEVADFLFEGDYCNAHDQLTSYVTEWEWGYNFEDLPDPAKIALVDMCYNMGIGRLQGFEQMFLALQDRDWGKVHDECLDSIYGRDEDSKVRAKSNAKLFLSCKEWVDKSEVQFRNDQESKDSEE